MGLRGSCSAPGQTECACAPPSGSSCNSMVHQQTVVPMQATNKALCMIGSWKHEADGYRPLLANRYMRLHVCGMHDRTMMPLRCYDSVARVDPVELCRVQRHPGRGDSSSRGWLSAAATTCCLRLPPPASTRLLHLHKNGGPMRREQVDVGDEAAPHNLQPEKQERWAWAITPGGLAVGIRHRRGRRTTANTVHQSSDTLS